jgi:hypothetical protein
MRLGTILTILLIRLTHMKTTIELPDDLLKQAKQTARAEGATLRALIEEGLQHALRAREKRETVGLDFPTFGGTGLTEAFSEGDWSQLRNEIYRGRGG